MDATRLTIPIVVAVSVVVSAAGAAVTITAFIKDLQSKIAEVERESTSLRSDLTMLKTSPTADPDVRTHMAIPLNTAAGISCDPGYAFTQLNVSDSTFYAAWKCVSVRPKLN